MVQVMLEILFVGRAMLIETAYVLFALAGLRIISRSAVTYIDRATGGDR